MDQIIDIFQYPFAIRALIASAMVGIMGGVLGCFIVLRNMALIGDALSHAILPGVVAGFLVAGYSVLGFFTGSVLAGLLAAVLMTWIQRNVKTQEDAAIGIVFTCMFALGVMGISYITHDEGVHLDLKDFLFGNILGVRTEELWMTAMVMGFTLLSVIIFYRYLFITTFESVVARTLGISVKTIHYFLMLLLSFAVVASLQSVGVILVVAMLITPASTAYLLTYRMHHMVWIAALVGLLSAIMGLLVAIWLETTPGPAMTVMATLLYLLAVFFSPSRGLAINYLRRRNKQQRILREDLLKRAVRLTESQELSVAKLANRLGKRPTKVKALLQKMARKGYFKRGVKAWHLTDEGLKLGYQLIRAHRLWETYLVEKVGLGEDQIHEEAERLEHLLPSEFLEEVATQLGHPRQDPHGSPIPSKQGEGLPGLISLSKGEVARISPFQRNHLVRSELWEMGIAPGSDIELVGQNGQNWMIKANGKLIPVPQKLAEKIRVEP